MRRFCYQVSCRYFSNCPGQAWCDDYQKSCKRFVQFCPFSYQCCSFTVYFRSFSMAHFSAHPDVFLATGLLDFSNFMQTTRLHRRADWGGAHTLFFLLLIINTVSVSIRPSVQPTPDSFSRQPSRSPCSDILKSIASEGVNLDEISGMLFKA